MYNCQRSVRLSCQVELQPILVASNGQRHPAFAGVRRYARAAAAVAAAGAAVEKRYAVVGAGLAGLATAYNLLKLSGPGHAVHVTLVDAVGIGAGGSGAAAGLLHPFTPRGKLLWKAPEAMAAAVELLEAAEQAAKHSPGLPGAIAWRTGMLRPAASIKQSQEYWKLHGQQQQQQQHEHQQQNTQAATLSVTAVHQSQAAQALLHASIADASTAEHLVPGVILAAVNEAAAAATAAIGSAQAQQQQEQQVLPQQRKQAKQQQRKLDGWSPANSATLYIPGGITLHPLHYMKALWAACQLAAAARADGSSARLHIQRLSSLAELASSCSSSSSGVADHHFDAVVVAAGAAVGSLAEFGDQLPIQLCQGYSLDMVPPASSTQDDSSSSSSSNSSDSSKRSSNNPSRTSSSQGDVCGGRPQQHAGAAYGAASPSLLGSPYLASQGGEVLVVGATKQHNWTAQQALSELGRTIDPAILQQHKQRQHRQGEATAVVKNGSSSSNAASGHPALGGVADEAAEISAAADELLAGAAAVWPHVTAWKVGGIRSGVRALPSRTPQGSVPLMGRWSDGQHQESDCGDEHSPPVWLVVGLGARGLVYHAWLGQLVVQAVLSGSEEQLPPELLAWRDVASQQAAKGAAASAAMQEAE